MGCLNRRALAIFMFFILAIITASPSQLGCEKAPGKPTFISFTGKGKGKESADKMKPIIEKLKKKYGDRVIFRDVDIDNPANKKEMEKYYVKMNPTYVILNARGEVKETFLGAAHEEMLESAISSHIPKEAIEKSD